MRIGMSVSEFRLFVDGFGLAMLILGCAYGAILLFGSGMSVLGVLKDADLPSAFEGLMLTAVGGGLRLLVRLDKRLETTTPDTQPGVR